MSSNPLVVAIDGPSGSGKSSVARHVAERLASRYLDTGAQYRALTWWCLQQGVDLGDRDEVARRAEAMPLTQQDDPRLQDDGSAVLVDGVAVDEQIRDSRISAVVSQVATNTGVREVLVARQRRFVADALAAGDSAVVEGRDITTVVAPDAAVRVLITADENVRMARRAAQLAGDAELSAEQVEATRDEVVRRDADDSTVAQFLTAADGVVVIDSTELTLEQTVRAVLDLVEAVRR